MVELLKFEDFDQMYSIMEQSFPYDEYRGYEGQKQLFENPEYKVFIHRNEETKEIDGFLSAWEFDDILFFEHFAVSSKVRNGGIGGRMLREVLTQVNKLTCLEVELPEGELEKRRISFYERNGFCYNPYPYTQPSIAPGREPFRFVLGPTREQLLKLNTRNKKSAVPTCISCIGAADEINNIRRHPNRVRLRYNLHTQRS